MAGAKKTKGKSARTKGPVAEIGVIGGSGLYSIGGLTNTREIRVKTPFGEPSDKIVVGAFEGKRVAFLARHGRGHRILPGELNFRANIYAMKLLGVQRIISVSAVGSLQENLRPGEFLVPDQFFDSTKGRVSTFFGNGLVAHVAFDKPTCPQLSGVLGDACAAAGVAVLRDDRDDYRLRLLASGARIGDRGADYRHPEPECDERAECAARSGEDPGRGAQV